MTDTSPLFRPFECKSLHLANRVAMAPMTRMRSPNYIPNDEVVAYYRRRAEAGVGLLITEGTTVNHKAANGYEQVPAFHGAALDGWKKVVSGAWRGRQDYPAALACRLGASPRHWS